MQTASAGIVYQFVNHPELAPFALAGTITLDVDPNDLPAEFNPAMVSAVNLQVLDTEQPVEEQLLFALDSTVEEIEITSDPVHVFLMAISVSGTESAPGFLTLQGQTSLNTVMFQMGGMASVSIFNNVDFSTGPFTPHGGALVVAAAIPEPSSLAIAATLFGGFGLASVWQRRQPQHPVTQSA